MNPITIQGFKAYDLRGRIPGELNEDVAYRVGRAYAEFVKPRKVIVGRDIRLSSEHHGPPDNRRFQYTPTWVLRGLDKLHLEFTPVPATS